MKIIGAPGQGSQSEGFLKPWLEAFPGIETRLEALSAVAGRDLMRLGLTAPEDEIKDTANAQRLIVAASISVYREVLAGSEFNGVVGHSVGEFAAAAIAGVLSDEDAIALVGVRADAMADAAARVQTSMAAVLGGEDEEIQARLGELGLQAANFNGSQLVVAGLKDSIMELVASPPKGARVIELKVAGAFHTDFMSSAVEALQGAAAAIEVSDPKLKLWTNRDGSVVTSGREFVDTMVLQTASPVRWDKCMASINAPGGKFVELPPAGALAGLVKRGAPELSALALKTPADLEKLESL